MAELVQDRWAVFYVPSLAIEEASSRVSDTYPECSRPRRYRLMVCSGPADLHWHAFLAFTTMLHHRRENVKCAIHDYAYLVLDESSIWLMNGNGMVLDQRKILD